MIPGVYDLGTYRRGDTLNEKTMKFTQTVGGATTDMDLTNVAIVAMFKKQVPPSSSLLMTRNIPTAPLVMSIANGYITPIDLTAGEIKFEFIVLDLDPGTYDYDVEFTFPSGEVKTYLSGTLIIEEDVTR